jgi:type I restriction enzyme S subunit
MQKLQKFKKTELDEIPEDWEILTVESFLKINMGQSPPSETYNLERKGLPFYQGVSDFGDIFPKSRIWCSNPKKIANENEILFSVRAPVGEINITDEKCCIGRGVASLIPINSNLKYCFYILKYFKNKFTAYSQGSTFEAINRDEIGKVKVPFISNIKEQQKIASILSNVDGLIQKTEQIIEQTQKLKKGLMQRLLTKGIGHTKFKKTELGTIAEEIELKKLGDYIDIISGEYFAYSEFSNTGIPVLKIDNVMYGKIDWTTRTYLSKEYLESHKQLILKEGDIVLALNRPITNNQVKVGILKKEDSPSILYQRVGKFQFKSNELRNDFFIIYLSSEIFKKLLSKVLIGSDQPYVKTTELKRQKVAFPEIKEQQKIASIVIPIINDIEIKQKYKRNLESFKKGLMQQLLTGKIRVKV